MRIWLLLELAAAQWLMGESKTWATGLAGTCTLLPGARRVQKWFASRSGKHAGPIPIAPP